MRSYIKQSHYDLFKGSRSGSYLTIEPKEGSKVPVAVWEVTTRDELALDRYEGYPNFYYKKDMKVKMKGLKLERNAYVTHSYTSCMKIDPLVSLLYTM